MNFGKSPKYFLQLKLIGLSSYGLVLFGFAFVSFAIPTQAAENFSVFSNQTQGSNKRNSKLKEIKKGKITAQVAIDKTEKEKERAADQAADEVIPESISSEINTPNTNNESSSNSLPVNSTDSASFIVSSNSNSSDSSQGESSPVKVTGLEPEEAEKKAKKELTDLVQIANSNVETSVASTSDEAKNGSYNADDNISSLSSITYHTNNDALCLEGYGSGKPDGANCKTWLDRNASEHGKESDSSPLERKIYQLWEATKAKISETSYRIWNIALKKGEKVLDDHGRLNLAGLRKYELNEAATKAAGELGERSADQALRNTLGPNAPKDGEAVAPPPEALRAIAVNITRAMANAATAKWAGIQTAKKGIEVITNLEVDAKKYKTEVEKNENSASGEERLSNQAALDGETIGLSLEDRVARAEVIKKLDNAVINPEFEGDKLVSGDPNKEGYDEWAYRATIEQLSNPLSNAREMNHPEGIEISDSQVATPLSVGSDSPEESQNPLKVKMLTTKQQIESYNRQLEIAARNMEVISAISSSFVNTSEQIRANKLKAGETILTINDLTPFQKRELNKGVTTIEENPNPKVQIPTTASELTITQY
ncbi:MAG: hypothetical protein EXR74_03300 [Bdellovibrionales bacterium]|nr:hypothetical protein [Bdellovibrionales bacterium]